MSPMFSRRVAIPRSVHVPVPDATRVGKAAGDGAGQTIGIIELGGGYHPADNLDLLGRRKP